MISWTIPVPTTVSPETSVSLKTAYTTLFSSTENGAASVSESTSINETYSTITQSNGNTLVLFVTESTYTQVGDASPDYPEGIFNTGGEGGFTQIYSSRTNGEVLSGTAFDELAMLGTTVSREGTSITGTRTAITTVFAEVTEIQTTHRTLWTTTASEGETVFASYTQSVQTTGTSIGSLTQVKTTTGDTTFSEYGVEGDGGGWPTYATATVLHLEPNEVAWICTGTLNQWAHLSQIAQSYSGSATVYASFTTFVKDKSNVFDALENTGIAQSASGTQSHSFSSHTNNTVQGVTLANIGAGAAIPFPTFSFGSIVGQIINSQVGVATQGLAAGGATKGIWTSTTAYVGTRSTIINNVLGERSTAYPTTKEFTAPLGESGTTEESGATNEGDDIYALAVTTQSFEARESTGSNIHPLGFIVIQAEQPTRFEQSYVSAAAAFNESIGSNLDLPVTIEGVTFKARLSQIAAIPYPSTYAGSVGGDPATITVGENITVKIADEVSSYDLGVVGEPVIRKSSRQRDLRGGKGPLGQTLFIGPGAYEAFPDNGASFTTSWSEQVSFVETAEGVTNYRPSVMVLAQRGAAQRYLVQSYATTTASTFF